MTSPNPTDKLLKARRAAHGAVRELGILYLLVRDEIDARVEKEVASGAFDPDLRKLMLLASSILQMRIRFRRALGDRPGCG